MKKLDSIAIAGQSGFVFEGELSDTYCFVPQKCLREEDGSVRIAELAYVKSGWDIRNMRFSTHPFGNHLFPRIDRPVADLGQPKVQEFLQRLRRIGSVAIAAA